MTLIPENTLTDVDKIEKEKNADTHTRKHTNPLVQDIYVNVFFSV